MSPSTNVRGIEHVGITVPDVDAATEFLVAAFDADVLFDMAGGAEVLDEQTDRDNQARLGTRPGTRWVCSRLLCIGDGPGIELFEYADDDRRPPATASDLGVTHLALYVDDIDEARERVIAAGGKALDGPRLLPGPESGENNKWLYTLTPWGSIVELVSLPSPQEYEQHTPLRRWKPGTADSTRAVAIEETT
jgi:catechol 2,3-dioxygenase-like lactoylglutathione lyase family enzyme